MIPLGILLFLLLVFVILFYSLQRYVVYSPDGVYIDFSRGEQDAGDGILPGTAGGVTAEIVYDAPDYSDLGFSAGADLQPVKALYMSFDSINADSLAAVSAHLSAQGADSLMLEMKNREGMLAWFSGVQLAADYGTNGTLDIASLLAPLKEQGIYLTAQISCCVDEYMALRNPPMALATAQGTVYSDTTGVWLDPSSSAVRSYICDLVCDLFSLGFDEVVLADLEHPLLTDGTQLAYSQQSSAQLTPQIMISSFAIEMREAADAAGGRLSVLCNAASFRSGQSEQTGQDGKVFAQVFDRYYWPTDGNVVSSDMELAAQSLPRNSLASRFVPVMYSTAATESWAYPIS